MAVVIATVTNKARQFWPQYFGGIATPWNPQYTYFKIGRGGWINPGSGAVPRIADPTLEDLDIIQNPSRYAPITGNIYYWQNSLIAANFSFSSPTTLNIRCILDFGQFNDIQGVPSTPPGGPTLAPSGTAPQLWELGIFSAPPPGYTSPTVGVGSQNLLMVVYGTFNLETKNSSIQLENDVLVTF
jgi:hypothetical protein